MSLSYCYHWAAIFAVATTFFQLSLHSYRAENEEKKNFLEEENRLIQSDSDRIRSLYELKSDERWRDVTDKVLANPDTSPASRKSILEYQRRIIVFQYPSDGLKIKGFFSYTPHPEYHPLLILYRWGNMNFALMNPGVEFATYRNYTVISSTLRGGVSEGHDEFGGADVDDMKHLMDFLPTLAAELKIELRPSCVFMLGPSRGGLEMFLTLARFPELQDRVNKIVAISGILDMHRLIQDRPDDMKTLFQNQFGLKQGPPGEAWIAKRDPLNTVPYLKKSLPILIIQGTADQRVDVAQGRHMTDLLKKTGHHVRYWEIPNGNHVLMNTPYIMNDIAQWLESNSSCTSIYMERKKTPVTKGSN